MVFAQCPRDEEQCSYYECVNDWHRQAQTAKSSARYTPYPSPPTTGHDGKPHCMLSQLAHLPVTPSRHSKSFPMGGISEGTLKPMSFNVSPLQFTHKQPSLDFKAPSKITDGGTGSEPGAPFFTSSPWKRAGPLYPNASDDVLVGFFTDLPDVVIGDDGRILFDIENSSHGTFSYSNAHLPYIIQCIWQRIFPFSALANGTKETQKEDQDHDDFVHKFRGYLGVIIGKGNKIIQKSQPWHEKNPKNAIAGPSRISKDVIDLTGDNDKEVCCMCGYYLDAAWHIEERGYVERGYAVHMPLL
ncbi:uncharacterized protein C8R40DRAFT_1126213 [Lentinula edodes]|uniref:uncharacterized protein n=1 Tax=Lentinula edodes TaxID=5353 RepID=UPI001E8CF69B|nr:uncharacterized protein C8R40DRAFT_1126213 [Lentinula edodes]KAH7870543.1 hypothetical protein C8R40DRAFT_1126213 [Lentinula edodes]